MNNTMNWTPSTPGKTIIKYFSPLTVITCLRKSNIRIIHTILIAIILAVIISVGCHIIIAAASDKPLQESTDKYYSSIIIEENDTLWDIEARYNKGEDSKIQYISNIMKINNMTSDVLYIGQNLIIYYY